MVDLSAAHAESLPDSETSSENWRDRLTADSPLWAPDDPSEANDGPAGGRASGSDTDSASDEATGDRRADGERRRSSWLLVASLRESAQALALAALPDDVDVCLAEAEE